VSRKIGLPARARSLRGRSGGGCGGPPDRACAAARSPGGIRLPAVSDVVEVDDAVRVLLEIPGVPPASVQIRVLGNRIEITGEKTPDFPAGETSFLCLERIFGKFQRAFEVRGAVNLGEVSARMANGILVITIRRSRNGGVGSAGSRCDHRMRGRTEGERRHDRRGEEDESSEGRTLRRSSPLRRRRRRAARRSRGAPAAAGAGTSSSSRT